MSPLFVDAWGWLVLANTRDPAHGAVLALRQHDEESRLAWVTTDYVLDEAVTRLFATFPFPRAEEFCRRLFQARDAGSLLIEAITPERFDKAFLLRLRYRDKPRISFTDFTSFVVMKELGLRRVLTEDAHFLQVGLGFETVP